MKEDISIPSIHLLLERLSSSDEGKPHNLVTFVPENRVVVSWTHRILSRDHGTLHLVWFSFLNQQVRNSRWALVHTYSSRPRTPRSIIYLTRHLTHTLLTINVYVRLLFSSLVQTLNPLYKKTTLQRFHDKDSLKMLRLCLHAGRKILKSPPSSAAILTGIVVTVQAPRVGLNYQVTWLDFSQSDIFRQWSLDSGSFKEHAHDQAKPNMAGRLADEEDFYSALSWDSLVGQLKTRMK